MTSLMSRALIGASTRALAATLALAAFGASPAAAQRVDRIVAFGDSYADDNNAFQLGYANPQALAIYPTGRFSGGLNYIDALAAILGVPVENFAIGGAFGGTNNGTLCFDPVYGAPLCGKGLQYEIDQFLNVGAQSPVFPNATPTFDESDLLTVSIGGNDARIYQQLGGSLAVAPAAGTAAAAATSVQLDRLVAVGAPTISFLAGDTGRLPEVAPFPSLAAVRSAFSGAFNTSMQSTLAGYAADGVMVHYLDLNLVLDDVQANPAAYGITNGLVCPIFPDPTCLLSSAGYLFYGDALHLTTAGFAIVGQYVATQLTAPLTLQAPSDVALDTARQFGRTLTTRMNFGSSRDGDMAEGLKVFLAGDVLSRSVDATDTNDEFKITGHGGTAGVEYGFGSGVVGLAANLSRPKAEFGNDAARTKGESLQVGGYAGLGVGGGFVQGYAGYGKDDHDVTRRGVVEPMSGDAEGSHWIAGARAGYLLPMGDLSVGPVAALDYAKAKVDGYTESGDAALTLNVDSISAKSLRGSIGAELRGDLTSGGLKLWPYGTLVVEKELSGGDRSVSFAQTSAPGIVNRFAFEDISRKAYARFTGGGSAAIFNNTTLDAGVSLTFGKDQGDETSGHVGLKMRF